MAEKPPIRVGLMLDGFTAPAWVRAMLQFVARADYAQLALVVFNSSNETSHRPDGPVRRLLRAWRWWLYIAYGKLDRRRFARAGRADALEPAELGDLLADVPVLEVRPQRTKFSDYLSEEDVEAIRSHDLDVLVRLGFRILRGDVLRAARHGVWSFHHGDNRVNRGGPPGFWEVMHRRPITGSILQVLSEDLDAGRVLARSFSHTHPLSVHANLNNVLWKSLHLLPRMLKRVHQMGGEAFEAAVDQNNRHPQFYAEPLSRQPTNRQAFRPLLGLGCRAVRRKLASRLTVDQWRLMYRLADRPATSFWRFTPITPPPDRFWADPHVIERDGRYYIFIEEYLYRLGKAHISVIEMDEQGNHGEARPVLNRPYHLSYPFLLEHGGETFLLPESASRPGIEVYRAVEFPDRWLHHTTLLPELSAADATLLEQDDRWWLFVNLAAGPGCSTWDELFLFYANEPLGRDWMPHPLNPIVSDVRRARPAGSIFTHGGRLYRPAQDCSRDYGYGLAIHEILTLSPTDYAERQIAHVEPNWDRSIHGVHTYNHAGRLTVIDVKHSRWRRF